MMGKTYLIKLYVIAGKLLFPRVKDVGIIDIKIQMKGIDKLF